MKNVLKKMLALVLALTLVAGLLPALASEASATVSKVTAEVPTIASKEWTGETLYADIADTEIYTVSGNNGFVDAGTYPIVLTLVKPDTYEWATGDKTEVSRTVYFEITGGPSQCELNGHKLVCTDPGRSVKTVTCENCDYSCKITMSVGSDDPTYTGDPITCGTVTYSTDWVGETPVLSYENNVNSFTITRTNATVRATFAELGITLENSFFILPADMTKVTAAVTPASAAYTGEKHEPQITLTFNGKTLVEGTDYTLGTWSGDLTAVGLYGITVTGTGNFTESKAMAYTVDKAELPTITFTQKGTLAYTGEAQIPEVESSIKEALGNAISFVYSDSQDGVYEEELPGFTEIGTHTVYYRATAKNHAPATGSFTVTIGKAVNEWTVTPAIEGWSYGETPKTPVAEAKYGDYTVTYTGTTNADVAYDSATAPTEAGTYKAIFTVAEGDDYGALTAEVDFIVDRAIVTPADITYTKPDLTYNGQNRANDILGSLVAPVAIRVNFTNVDTGVDEFPVNAGNYSFKVRVAEATDNYYFGNGEYMQNDAWVFTIKKAIPTVTREKTEFTYDGQPHGEVTVTLVNDETYTGTITYEYRNAGTTKEWVSDLPINAGTYDVRATIPGTANYSKVMTSAGSYVTIKPKPVTPTLTAEPETFRYSGKAHRPEAVVKINGEVLALEDNYKIDYINNIEVGIATLKITCLNTSNYIFDPVSTSYLILPNLSDLSGITPENVTSAYQPIIDAHQEDMDGVDTSTVSENAQDNWNEIVEYLASLEAAIKEIQAAMQQFIDETAALPDHPTGDDLGKIDELLDLYEDIQDQLTDEEKEDLADEIEKLETEKDHIGQTNKIFEEVVADAEEILDKDLTYKDKDDVEDILDRINDLLEDPHLTDEQREILEDLKDQLEDIMDDFDAAAEVEEMIDELPKTGDPDDKDLRDEYKEVKEAYDKLPNKDLVNPKAVAKLEKLAKALRDYKIIKGDNQWWYTNDEEPGNLTLTANGPYSKFDYIKIDGQIIDEKHYTSREGSTIVTLKESFLETLSYARHTISIGFTDGELSGEATGHFRVTLHLDSPATGDTTNLVLFGILGLSSLLALAALTVIRKKRGA